ncbi:seven-hairpin glycosidase [Lentinus tigrinus ALCF2SS1-7]|uniref:alpha-1,2-Mannosidase n=1 Tax=Lentinus tigrinus ALCF2SS1-6 TaxID=1328759 RepID=A0A5C2RNC2_9APHY|nr:seven-hairpin glycosidase [Lentinus tigrinus ALCF2SS1-6]RPD76734.1 seven-hairpin glycosidase [Lentinus tigrinus ALCF2SS1-7]
MDALRKKRVYRLIPLGVVATCLLWGLMQLATPSGPEPDRPWLYPPPPHDHPFRHPPPPPPYGPGPKEHTKWSSRADAVRDAFRHAYGGYVKYAGSNDELLPVSNRAVDNFNGWRLTLVDSLDTMLLMGLHDEFREAVPILANMTFALEEGSYAPFFETVIRYLGGLLSAYALSGEPILLARADDLGSMLLPAFNTTHGLPMYAVNTVSGKTRTGWTGSDILWAEALSCQMEYKYLAHLTGRKYYFDNVERIMEIMYTAELEDDQFPTKWSVKTGMPSNDQFSVGAFADSAHEYLLKQYLLSSMSEPKVLDLYLRDISSVLRNLLYITPNRQLLYVTGAYRSAPTHTLEHLSCFLPGLLALGAHTLPLAPRTRQLHQWAAQGLAYTCWITYADSETGLGPDEMAMKPGTKWLDAVDAWERKGRPGGVPPGLAEVPPVRGQQAQKDYVEMKTGYLLRPETVESFYLMWRTTGDEAWRERGWAVFQAIEKEARTESGYASLSSVTSSPAPKKDEMPSFFTAETLKYLYLLFTDEDLIPLDRWVFNTEAHPLPVFEWSDWEKERYGISGPGSSRRQVL